MLVLSDELDEVWTAAEDGTDTVEDVVSVQVLEELVADDVLEAKPAL